MKISNEFKIRQIRLRTADVAANFPIDFLLGNWCMSVYFASFLVGKQDPYEYHCEPYERVVNETTTGHMRSLFAYTHCRVCLLFFVS